MFIYRYIHIIMLILALLFSYAITHEWSLSSGRIPSNARASELNQWSLEFSRTKKIWGVYELKDERIDGLTQKTPTHAMVRKNELHLFRETIGAGLETQVVHLMLPFEEGTNKNDLTLKLDQETQLTLQAFTGGRYVEKIECHKKWQTMTCSAELATLVGPPPPGSEIYSE